jgi:hypothetical protein
LLLGHSVQDQRWFKYSSIRWAFLRR